MLRNKNRKDNEKLNNPENSDEGIQGRLGVAALRAKNLLLGDESSMFVEQAIKSYGIEKGQNGEYHQDGEKLQYQRRGSFKKDVDAVRGTYIQDVEDPTIMRRQIGLLAPSFDASNPNGTGALKIMDRGRDTPPGEKRFQIRELTSVHDGLERVLHDFDFAEEVTIGRSITSDVNLSGGEASRDHARLIINPNEDYSQISVLYDDSRSTNGSYHDLGNPLTTQNHEILDDYTQRAGEDFHPIYPDLTRDSGINFHVSRHVTGEDIVVDDSELSGYQEQYDGLYKKLLSEMEGLNSNERVIGKAFALISREMKYSLKAVEKIGNKALSQQVFDSDGRPQEKDINLGEYLKQKKGVCRHQGIALAYLLERYKRETGMLEGTVTYKRTKGIDSEGNIGGHGWASYTNRNDETYILDVANDFNGTVEEGLQAPGSRSRFYREIYR